MVSGRAVSVKNIVNRIIAQSGRQMAPEFKHPPAPGYDYICNNEKMLRRLGPEQIELEEGLRQEYEYFASQ